MLGLGLVLGLGLGLGLWRVVRFRPDRHSYAPVAVRHQGTGIRIFESIKIATESNRYLILPSTVCVPARRRGVAARGRYGAVF